MSNIKSFWEEKENGVILDNITIALSVLAKRRLDDVQEDRMFAIAEQAMSVSGME